MYNYRVSVPTIIKGGNPFGSVHYIGGRFNLLKPRTIIPHISLTDYDKYNNIILNSYS